MLHRSILVAATRCDRAFESRIIFTPINKKSTYWCFFVYWGEWWDSNPRPSGPQPDALTNWATPTICGVPWGIRTLDLLLRRQLLYPAELKAHFLERVMGIEPTWPAWKAGVLPLNYTRVKLSFHIISRLISFVNSFIKTFSSFFFCLKSTLPLILSLLQLHIP